MTPKKKWNKLGLIASVTQLLISISCLIWNYVHHESMTLWFIMLCSGICLLSSNLSQSKKDK